MAIKSKSDVSIGICVTIGSVKSTKTGYKIVATTLPVVFANPKNTKLKSKSTIDKAKIVIAGSK